MNVLRYVKLVAGGTNPSETHLYHVERPDGHFLLYFQGGGSLSYDAKATGDETEVARAFDQELANLESGTYHNEVWEVESENFDAEAEKRLKIFDHPTWGIKWDQVGGAPSDEAQFCEMLEKQIKKWKGSSHGMAVANHPYWPTFHAMVVEAVTEQFGDPIRLYRGIHYNQAADILAGETVSMRRFSAWTSDLSSARVYAAGKTKRGNLDWVVVQRDFSPAEIMFAPVVLAGPCEQPDILMELMYDVEHSGDEFIVSLPELVPGDYKVAAKPRHMRESALRGYIRQILLESTIHPKIEAQLEKFIEMGLRLSVMEWGTRSGTGGASIQFSIRDKKGAEVGRLDARFNPSRMGPCNFAHVILGSGVEAQHGLGPLLYDLAFEVAEKQGLGGLGPDPREVSDEAKAVWDYYLNSRSDIEAKQRDFKEVPQTEDPDDDCYNQDTLAKRFKGQAYSDVTHHEPVSFNDPDEGWDVPTGYTPEFIEYYFDPKNSLSKTYHKRSTGTPILDRLRAEFLLSPITSRDLGLPYTPEEIKKYLEDNPGRWPRQRNAFPLDHVFSPEKIAKWGLLAPENKLPIEAAIAEWTGESTP